MSRVEENENMIQSTRRVFNGKPDDVLCQIEGQKLGVLLDISKSLAIIADNVRYLSIDIGGEIAFKNKEKEETDGN